MARGTRVNRMKRRKTLVGSIDDQVLAFTAGRDVEIDLVLAEADCIGTAAHVTMLSRLRGACGPLFGADERDGIVAVLVDIIRAARSGSFKISRADQDVHLAVERLLTRRLGELGKRVHTGRSRNDQAATDLRLHGKVSLLDILRSVGALALTLARFARRHRALPMVGRTHMRPAMPSTVGIWAAAHAESLIDDTILLKAAYEVNDRCPLGSAAGYGVPLGIDRGLTARLLGFRGYHQSVLYASNARGKCESTLLSAAAQVMLTLSRMAEDLITYSMPEFGYFILPDAYCTGSSIMPQKSNPDVLELVRARAAKVSALAGGVAATVCGLPSGYSRDLQETKEPFIDGLAATLACASILTDLVRQLRVDPRALKSAFSPRVFAADRALDMVSQGIPFRDAYDHVKSHIGELDAVDPDRAVLRRSVSTAIDFRALMTEAGEVQVFARKRRQAYERAISRLLAVSYPSLKETGSRPPRSSRRKGKK